MTLQISEVFLYQDQKLLSHDYPLASHPTAPEFVAMMSLCWRGYNGTWRIQDKQLFLIKLNGYVKHPTRLQKRRVIRFDEDLGELCFKFVFEPKAVHVNLHKVFPQTVDNQLFADWFNGDIHFGQGDVEDQGMTNSYKEYLTLTFQKGILVNEKIQTSAEVFPPKLVD